MDSIFRDVNILVTSLVLLFEAGTDLGLLKFGSALPASGLLMLLIKHDQRYDLLFIFEVFGFLLFLAGMLH